MIEGESKEMVEKIVKEMGARVKIEEVRKIKENTKERNRMDVGEIGK